MASALVDNWLFATVPVVSPRGRVGTGFLVWRTEDERTARAFLVTAKHVIQGDGSSVPDDIACVFNTGGGGAATITLELDASAGGNFREHPDDDVDVAAVEVTKVIGDHPEIEKRWVDVDSFADAARRSELDVTVAEEVFVIGYPLGLHQGDTPLPLVRQGIISSAIGSRIRDRGRTPAGTVRERALRAFLVDGATVPGASGSPVVLKPVVGRRVHDDVVLEPAPPLLLGIMAETKYAPRGDGRDEVPGFTGLGLAFEAETIAETIDLFFDATVWSPGGGLSDARRWVEQVEHPPAHSVLRSAPSP
jgi:hypothetical protein